MVFYDEEEDRLVGGFCPSFFKVSRDEEKQKKRKKVWQLKGKAIAELMKLFYRVRENTVKLDQKVREIRFFHSQIDDSSIDYLERSFSWLEERVGYLEKDKNPHAFKQFRNSLNHLLNTISDANEMVADIHIPPLPATYYSFKDFLSFFLMVTEIPLKKDNFSRTPERELMHHAHYVYHRYMKNTNEEDGETYADEKEKLSPTQFRREEITVLHHFAVEAKEFFWRDGVDYFPSCLPEDIREFAAALSLLGEVWSEGKEVKWIIQSLDSLNMDLQRFRKEFRNFIKQTIPMPFIGDPSPIKKCSKESMDEDF